MFRVAATRWATAGAGRLRLCLEMATAAQRGRLALWLPVFMGAGVLLYFSLGFEPAVWAGGVIAVPAGVAAVLVPRARLVLLPVLAAALGFASAQMATLRMPPLEPLPRGAVVVSGRVAAVELLPAGRRLTVARPSLGGEPMRRSLRVRLRANDPAPVGVGDAIRVRALVQAPSPPAYPGGWDLQRDAFFSGLGGYGFAIGPVEVLARQPANGVERVREAIARRFQAVLPGAPGAVAATLLTGVPTAIPEEDREAFRASGLAHLLAVAGLHIGIVMGLVFGAVRMGLAAWEYAALRWPTKQIAAVTALAAGGGYMVLTGMHLPIMRSFAMAALVTVAVLAGRRPISLRGLALAAVVLMLVEPEQVPGVSFQMSFAAVLALIAGYEAVRPWLHTLHGDGAVWRRFALHVAALALTSLLAGTASAPFGAYHFGKVQSYFVVANMIAVPMTAMWVMPAGLVALGLMPLGLERLALVPMGWGVDGILWVARTTAGWPAATAEVPHMPAWGLAVLGLWRGWVRLAGVVLIAVGLVSPGVVRPPDLLVSADARMVGVRTAAGMFVEQGRGASKFVRDSWRQYWAVGPPMPMPREGAVAEGVVVCAASGCVVRPAAGSGAAVVVRGGRVEACAGVSVVVGFGRVEGGCPGVVVIDRAGLMRDGAAAVWLGRVPEVATDRAARGARPWVLLGPVRVPERLDLPLAPAGA